MALRKMSNSIQGFEFYTSTFDADTGVLVREVEVPDRVKNTRQSWWRPTPTLVESFAKHKGLVVRNSDSPALEKFNVTWATKFGKVTRRTEKDANGVKTKTAWPNTHPWRLLQAFSPVPETIDVKITDWCNFGCSYCLTPETRVLLEDGKWLPISEVEVGASLLGFEEHRSERYKHRKLQPSTVLHKWKTLQPEMEIELASGQVIRTSPNHLWLSSRSGTSASSRSGWFPTSKLRAKMSLLQIPTWENSSVTLEDKEFKKGYLSGLSWGDGTFNFDQEKQVYWRVAVADTDILDRAYHYLCDLDISCPGIRPFDSGTENALPMSKVEVRNTEGLTKLQELLEQARLPSLSDSFKRGFVSGFFDAEGSLELEGATNLRICQKNHVWALNLCTEMIQSQGFAFAFESVRDDGLQTSRLEGNYWDVLRFFNTFQPACRRKYPHLDGSALRSEAVKIVDVRSTGRFVEMVDVTTSSHTFFAEGIATHNCYMDSTTKGKHAPRELLLAIFEGLSKAPYQIAFGGGEPTAHPDFPWFLEETRKRGTVPNYTTAGHILRDEVFEATNKFCGGVALTYHAFKGPEYFKKTYDTWRARLDARVQINVHVIFDKDVADNLLDLQDVGLKDLNVVLLAYYPDIGRANWEGLPSKGVYEVTLPNALKTVQSSGFKIAFSEGLLPYFLSHQLPEVDTRFACQQEGLFSCYIDNHGRMSHSSFDPPTDEDQPDSSIYRVKLQKLWNKMAGSPYPRHYDACGSCKFEPQCHVPNEAHFLLCKFAEHNASAATCIPARKKRLTVLEG